MSITREITIWCDREGCTEWTQFNDHDSEHAKVTVARKLAGRTGWTYNSERGDWCPAHSQGREPGYLP